MNLKDMQRREIEFLKKIGLYSSVSLSTMQKICKYVSAIIVFVYLVFVQVKTPFLSDRKSVVRERVWQRV